MKQIHAAAKLLSRILEILKKQIDTLFYNQFFQKSFENFQKYKNLTYVRGDISICMCTEFQVNNLGNGAFRAFQRPKMATFRDNPCITKNFFRFYSFLQAPNVVLMSFFELQTINNLKTCIMRQNDPNHKIDLVTYDDLDLTFRSRKAQNDALEC